MKTYLQLFSAAASAAEAGNFKEALRIFEEIDDTSNANDPAAQAIRRTYVYFAWANLGTVYPAALKSLEERAARREGADQKAIQTALQFVAGYGG